MPSAPKYLQDMFEDDAAAFRVIDENFKDDKFGIIRPRVAGYKPTEEEGNAIDYLCAEWDYAYEGEDNG